MSATVLYMSMSLDGFVAGPNAGPGNGLGDGGERLHEWMHLGGADPGSGVPGRPAGINGKVFDEIMATGAIVAGRGDLRAGERLGWRPPRRPADLDPQPPRARHRREPVAAGHLHKRRQDAMTEAKRAAGEKNVLVHGAATAQLALAAGLLDELEIHLIPVLLGQGRRMFDNLGPQHIELQRTRIIEGEDGVTHTHYRVAR